MTDIPTAFWASMPVPAIIVRDDDTILELNPAAETFLNASAKIARNTSLWRHVSVDLSVQKAVIRARQNQSSLSISDAKVRTEARGIVECSLQIGPMVRSASDVVILLIPTDIAGKLGRSMQSQSSAKSAIGMAEMLAHEIKNPLAGITGAAQLIKMNLSGEDIELSDLIVEECKRIVKLLDQVEQFGNLSPPNRATVNIHDVLERARKSAGVGFAAHMEISQSYDPSLPATFADADQLLQVFLNLLKNAAEAGKPRGTIHIRTFFDLSLRLRKSDGSGAALPLQVEIIDNGPGLPDDIAANIFEPFVSGRENGTGLGLALVSKIIADHKGWIAVQSHPGRTVFRVSLPIAAPLKEPR